MIVLGLFEEGYWAAPFALAISFPEILFSLSKIVSLFATLCHMFL